MRKRWQEAPSTGRVLCWLFSIQLLSMAAMEMSAPFWPLQLRALGLDSPQVLAWASALVYAGPMATAMLMTPLWGRLGDRRGHKPMLLRALFALAATQLWVANTDSVISLLTARLVQGGVAGFIAAAQAYGACLVSTTKRGRLMARLQISTALGSIIGPVLGGVLFDLADFRSVNLLASALCLLCCVVAWWVLPHQPAASIQRATPSLTETQADSKRAAVTTTPQTTTALLNGAIAGSLLAIVLLQSAKMMPQVFFGLYAEQILLLPAWAIGIAYGAPALGLCLAAPVWGRRSDQRSQAAVLQDVEWVCWTCIVVVILQAMASSLVVFLLARVLWGACLAGLLPVMVGMLSRSAQSHRQGALIAAASSAAKAGALFGSGIGALALLWLPLQYAFWAVAVMYGMAAITLRVLRRNPRSGVLLAAIDDTSPAHQDALEKSAPPSRTPFSSPHHQKGNSP